jgi:hypothetical protein
MHPMPEPIPDIDQISDHDVLVTEDLLRYIVSVATRAPSIHNTQPWRFVASGSGELEIFAERSRQLPVLDPEGRQLHISAGAAVHHAVLAVHGIGRRAHVALLPDRTNPDLLARISIHESQSLPDPEEWALLHATRDRHTHRSPFVDGRLPKTLLVDLAGAAARQGGHVRFVEAAGERRMLSDAVAEATSRLEADPGYRSELLAWSGRPADAADGVPASASSPPVAGDEFRQRIFAGGTPTEHLWMSREAAEHPDILLLWSPTDSPADWLRTGAALSALLLTATCAGVAASMLNQPVEIPALRQRIRRELRLPGHPQLLLRMGYAARATPTARRPVTDVLTTSSEQAGT